MADGLSDALRQMADGEHARPRRRPDAPTVESPADTPMLDASHDGVEPQTDAAANAARRRPASAQAAGGSTATLATAAVLLVMGLAMAGLGVWATFVLLGRAVWRSDQPGASTVAMGLLVTYPIAACLLGAAGFLLRRAGRS